MIIVDISKRKNNLNLIIKLEYLFWKKYESFFEFLKSFFEIFLFFNKVLEVVLKGEADYIFELEFFIDFFFNFIKN